MGRDDEAIADLTRAFALDLSKDDVRAELEAPYHWPRVRLRKSMRSRRTSRPRLGAAVTAPSCQISSPLEMVATGHPRALRPL